METDYFGRTHAHIEILAVSSATEGRGAARSLYERLGYAPESLHYVKPLT